MAPEPNNFMEFEGVLNPAAVRGPDGQLYLFPRLVAQGNYSRIGIARVQFDSAGDPVGVERLGIALEPDADYEHRADGSGGCEDPRITFVAPLQRYLMTYTALSPDGPRIALAESVDLWHWQRLGLATFVPCDDVSFAGVDDKDASIFPIAIDDPAGQPSMAMLHRPLFPGTRPEETACQSEPRVVDRAKESIWISYCPMALTGSGLGEFSALHRLATPVAPWERLKIGGGTPPILTRFGWLILYHGVSLMAPPNNASQQLCYAMGAMVLAKAHPRDIRYRSAEPLLTPLVTQAHRATNAYVVFPTGIDQRTDIGAPDRFDIYFGMDDYRIGVARLDLPETLPTEAHADHPSGSV
jgi:predicted GH43/DUF377 family glycosyl hydrolase